jgi:putative heme-binding domain-containing protein
MWVRRLNTLLFAAGTLVAQHDYASNDVEEGRRLFQANCAACHGPDGDSVPGVDLGHGKYRRASSDDDLFRIIKSGIPGTAMPPHTFVGYQMGAIVGYLRYMAASATRSGISEGDAVRGKAIFEGKGVCLTCHRVGNNGSRVGPDLSDVGYVRRTGELERSILEPDAEVLPQNRTFHVTTQDGTNLSGRLLNQDGFTVQLIDSKERLLSFFKSDLKEYGFVDKSPMPSYQGKLSTEELADLVSYLASLKGIDPR